MISAVEYVLIVFLPSVLPSFWVITSGSDCRYFVAIAGAID